MENIDRKTEKRDFLEEKKDGEKGARSKQFEEVVNFFSEIP